MNTPAVARLPGVAHPAEIRLWEAFAEGAPLDLAGEPDPAARTVRAGVIALLLRGGRGPAAAGDAPALRLRGARVAGRLDLAGVAVGPEVTEIRFDGCAFDAPMTWTGALLPGLALVGCRVPALDADRIRVQGPLEVRHCEIPGGVRLERGRAETDVVLTGSRLGPGPDGAALAAEGLTVGGALDLDQGLRAAGAVRLAGTRVAGRVCLDGAEVRAPGGDALVLDRSVLGDRLLARRLVVEGALRMFNADVAGSVQLTGARLDHPDGIALGASGASVRGAFWCSAPFTARGEVRLTGAELRTRLDLTGARLEHPGGRTALSLDRLTASDVGARGLVVARGTVSAVGAHVRDTLDLRGIRVPAIDLAQSRVGVLLDDPDGWPPRAGLGGLTYTSLHPVLPAAERLRWLERDPEDGSAAQAYEQLAQHYTGLGRPTDSRLVRYAARRRRRRSLTGLARAANTVLELTVGYGFRPWRALGWLVALVALGTAVFTVAGPTPLDPGKAPRFHAAAYTMDLLLPLVDLGQASAYQAGGATQWLSYALIGVGWVLASAVALGVGRALSRT
ncbi:oxidoreductase [Streptomyces sp. NPDC048507]|uniref:oxidoreductase n=1 Tax=Streptomyces sp. NPDC048507 TaxID=3365560 RepID=UPI00372493A6